MGSGSTLIEKKKFGQGEVIGAGAVRDIERDITSVGVPAKVIKISL